MSNYTSRLPLLSQAASEAASKGPAAMPLARTSKASCFSGKDDELLSEFLQEYEDLADGCRLTSEQKVDTII